MLESIQRWNLALIPIAVALAFASGGPRNAWSLALGALVGAANFWLTIQVVRRVFVPEPKSGGALMMVGKFLGLLALVTALVWWWKPDLQSFGLGFSTIVAAMFLRALYEAFRSGTEEEEET